MIIEIIQFILFLIVAIIAHEIGHIVVYKNLTGKTPEITFKWFCIEIGEEEEYIKMSNWDYYKLHIAGIVSGFVVILLSSGMVYYYLLAVYSAGCLSDIRNIARRSKNGRKKNKV